MWPVVVGRLARVAMGQLLTPLPLHFLLSLPAASFYSPRPPWKGGWHKCYQPSRRQTAPFCLWLLLYRQAFPPTKKTRERGDHNGLATHLTKPSLINTHPACRSFNLQLERGVQRGRLCAQCAQWQHGCRCAHVRIKADRNWDAAEYTEVWVK